jgi:hypothetical protein
MVIVGLFREEEPLRSVRDIKRPTLCAEDADACRFTSKKGHARHVATQLPDSESVHLLKFRRVVAENPEPQGNWNWTH